MSDERWARVEALFHEAAARPGAERDAYLAGACGGDRTLEAEVRSLLARDANSDRFLQASALDDAARARISTAAEPPAGASPAPDLTGEVVGHFRIVRRLGEGGMGVVYEAFDQRLERRVALKVLRADTTDAAAGDRLTREARVAARVVHPLICQVFDLGNADGRPYIAMELVEGESLADRLARGPMPPDDAMRTAAIMLDALAVLHGHGIVHRDLKPSNVFLTTTGLKLLDFGLARPVTPVDVTAPPLTAAGMFVGTPQYASPEQLAGAPVDARTDLFSAAVVAFEMLAGRPPFSGATLPALAHAVMYEAPPVLTGAAAIAAADRTLHRALAKAPADRYPTAQAFAADLRAALALVESGQTVEARPILRLAVLPFRPLKPDAETDYLGPSLADALVSSLSGLESLVVRSTLKSARYAKPPLDLDRLATDLAVDVVLAGTLLASKGRVRVSAELVTAPAGDVWWSHVTDASPDAVLELHDDLARQVLAALPLSWRDRRAAKSSAANEKAFEFYLRGMQLRAEAGALRQAHAFFVQQPGARSRVRGGLGRARPGRARARQVRGSVAARRGRSLARPALALDPDNGAAQYYLAQLEIDLGRVGDSLARLLDRAWQRRAEPQVFAALVARLPLLRAARRLGRRAPRRRPARSHGGQQRAPHLLPAARLEPGPRRTAPQQRSLRGAAARARWAAATRPSPPPGARRAATPPSPCCGLRHRAPCRPRGRRRDRHRGDGALRRRRYSDGEMFFYVAEVYALVGEYRAGVRDARRAVDGGFLSLPAFENNTFLAPLRATPRGRRSWPGCARRRRRRRSCSTTAAAGLLLGL